MSTIPSGTQFIGLASTVDTTERRSALINAESAAYTMQDIVDTIPSGPAYKVYTALLSQSGTSNPTVIVLQNTMTSAVTITRSSQGSYSVICNDFNFFTVNKTAISAISSNNGMLLARTAITNPTTFRIETFNYSDPSSFNVPNDGCLYFSMLEVRVYP